ncbi:NARS [Lepeophtheirus salmonis]|uniref:NARS n=1 Tax=Lepeophtheirus salmonis TaxID=72036 RepID=A0A7R8CSU0_LEPSM|nr:NARS [Lepeophtheirus salmonis]CAF2867535.1 NARS [Lepeophtheirus salmonis]
MNCFFVIISNNSTFDGVDLLFPKVGELVGGSLRENKTDRLVKRMKDLNVPIESLQWYLDLRKYGSAPTGGFGLGFERLVQFVLDVHNIKDTLPFSRTPHSCLL